MTAFARVNLQSCLRHIQVKYEVKEVASFWELAQVLSELMGMVRKTLEALSSTNQQGRKLIVEIVANSCSS